MPITPEVAPRHHTPRSDRPTRGGQIAAVAAAKGRAFMPWQRRAADVAFEYDPETGQFVYGTIVLTVPRQAGKTTWVGAAADHRCIRRPGSRVWITFQTGKMADSWMRNEHLPSLRPIGDPKSARSPYSQSLRAGETGPMWRNGSQFFTFPPLRDALHSKQSDLAIISEAWALTPEQGSDVRQAIRPTMLTRSRPGLLGAQLIVDSTVGDDGSTFLDGYIDLGIASLARPGSRVCIIDYGIPDDADPEDLDVIAAHHPAYGHTVTRQALLDAREEFEADPELGGSAGFARAYGNRSTRTRTAAFPAGVWERCGTELVDQPDRAGLAFDVSALDSDVGVTFSWRAQDSAGRSRLFVESVKCPADLDAAATFIVALAKRRGRVPIGYDTGSPATLDLADKIARRRAGVKLIGLPPAEFATACHRLDRAVATGELGHFRQADLDADVQNAARRPIRDAGFGWGRKASSGSISRLVAATVAVKMFDDLPPAPTYRVLTGTRA